MIKVKIPGKNLCGFNNSCEYQVLMIWCDEKGTLPLWYSSPKPSVTMRKYQTNPICGIFCKIAQQCLSKISRSWKTRRLRNSHRLEESKETWLNVTWYPILYSGTDIGGKTSEIYKLCSLINNIVTMLLS